MRMGEFALNMMKLKVGIDCGLSQTNAIYTTHNSRKIAAAAIEIHCFYFFLRKTSLSLSDFFFFCIIIRFYYCYFSSFRFRFFVLCSAQVFKKELKILFSSPYRSAAVQQQKQQITLYRASPHSVQ